MLHLALFVCECVAEVVGVGLGVGCPCPPIRDDIVTPRHLLYKTDRGSKGLRLYQKLHSRD